MLFETELGALKEYLDDNLANLEWPTPCDLHDVRSSLGFANFYRRFIRSYTSIAHPLTQLTRKELQFSWEPTQQPALETLKGAFTSADLLRHFDQTYHWCWRPTLPTLTSQAYPRTLPIGVTFSLLLSSAGR